MFKILVVDDEPELRSQLEWAARGENNGQEVVAAESGEQAIHLIQQQDFDVIVTDLKMETDGAGLNVLKAAKEKDIYTQVIVVTAYGTPEISVETMRLGAFDYLERNAPGTDALAMVRSKISLALEFRRAILERKSQ
jgi:DNA-binding NtrC family response regulator